MSNWKENWKTIASMAAIGATAVLVTATVVGALLSTLDDEDTTVDSEDGET